jgi:hypothetical protein
MTLMQRQPRVEEPAYLAYVRTLPCLICRRLGSDPAHLRAAAPQYGKRQCGMGEKPDDCWALPLCRTHHDDQHRINEMRWWARHGFHDPHAVAIALYASRPNKQPPRPRKASKVAVRKPAAQRAKVGKSRPMQSRNEWPAQSRKLTSRPLRKKV